MQLFSGMLPQKAGDFHPSYILTGSDMGAGFQDKHTVSVPQTVNMGCAGKAFLKIAFGSG